MRKVPADVRTLFTTPLSPGPTTVLLFICRGGAGVGGVGRPLFLLTLLPQPLALLPQLLMLLLPLLAWQPGASSGAALLLPTTTPNPPSHQRSRALNDVCCLRVGEEVVVDKGAGCPRQGLDPAVCVSSRVTQVEKGAQEEATGGQRPCVLEV